MKSASRIVFCDGCSLAELHHTVLADTPLFTSQEILTFPSGKGQTREGYQRVRKILFFAQVTRKNHHFFCPYRRRPYFWCLEFSRG
jgi:hypothetical protein